jgi:hypothetical protein
MNCTTLTGRNIGIHAKGLFRSRSNLYQKLHNFEGSPNMDFFFASEYLNKKLPPEPKMSSQA